MRSNRLFMGAAVAALALVLLSGCASLGDPTGPQIDAARLLVRGATVAYIERAPRAEQGAVANRILDVTNEVLEVAGNGEPITLQRLVQAAAEYLPSDLTPGRRVIALELIDVAAQALASRTGVGGLESDTLLRVRDVIDWVASVARLYAPSG